MRKLFSILLFAAISFAANAQSVIVPLDATGSGVLGGDNTGKIVSATWEGVDLPFAAPFVDSKGNSGTNKGLVTYVAINKLGTYNFKLTITDNKGTVTTGSMRVVAKQGQHTIIIFVTPIVTIYLNEQTTFYFSNTFYKLCFA